MNRPSLRKELNQPIPRPVKTRKSFITMLIFLTVLLLGPGLYCSYTTYKFSHDRAVLKESGISINAQITDLRIERGKNSQYYKVSYSFQPQAQPGNQFVTQTNTRQTDKQNFGQLQIGQEIPILFDPLNPSRSDLNFNDVLHKSDPYASMHTVLALIWSMFGGAYLFLLAGVLLPYFSEKKLVQYGNTAPATILRTELVQGRRQTVSAIYEFTDQQGMKVEGTQKGLPTEADRKSGKQSYWDNIMDCPTALYDPSNSKKNILYGAGSVLVDYWDAESTLNHTIGPKI